MSLKRLISRFPKDEEIKSLNDEILSSPMYKECSKIETTKTIFFDDSLPDPIQFSAAPRNWAIISEQFSKKLKEFKNPSVIVHFDKKIYEKRKIDAALLHSLKNEIPDVLKNIANSYISFNKKILKSYENEYQQNIENFLEKTQEEINNEKINLMEMKSVIKFIREKIKNLKNDVFNLAGTFNAIFPKKRSMEEVLMLYNEKKYTNSDICKMCKISRYKLKKLIKNSETNRLPQNQSDNEKPINTYLSSKEILFFKYLADKPDKLYSIREMAENFFSTFHYEIPMSTIWYHLKNTLHYSYKKAHFKHISAFNLSHKFACFDFCKTLAKYFAERKNVFFIDESGLYKNIQKTRCFAPINATPYKIKQAEYHKFNIILAINENNAFAYEIRRGSHCELSFLSFNQFLIAKILSLGQVFVNNTILVYDNISFHKSRKVIRFFELCPIKILYMPTYSPELSPIETVFAAFKKHIKKYYQKTEYYFFN